MIPNIASEDQARWDAQSLIAAEEIKQDEKRYKAAKDAMIKIKEEKQKELDAITYLANKKE
jgi:hypothetical protein